MTTTSPVPPLEDSFRQIAELLPRIPADVWTRDQNGKWTLAQEMAHLMSATRQTAQLFSPAARPLLWRANTRPSRSSEQIQSEYQAALATNPGITNPATAPTDELSGKTPAEQLQSWQEATTAICEQVAGLSDDDLDGFTVWKHPLLGPLTAREMVHFTGIHTRLHAASLRRKLGESPR